MTIKTRDFKEQFLNLLWNTKSADRIDDHVSPKAPIQTTFLSGLGPKVLQEKVQRTFQAFSNFEFRITAVHHTQNEAFYQWQGQGKHTGPLWPFTFKPSFQSITFQGIATGQFSEDGFMSRFSSFSNLPKILGLCERPAWISNTEFLSPTLDWQSVIHTIYIATSQRLTRREIECLKLWINGCSIKETARILDNISTRTVQTFRENLKRKLRVKTYQQLLRLIQHLGLMPLFLELF